jgi:hypothetical protein
VPVIRNDARRIAYETFRATFQDLFGAQGVTERRFRDDWLGRLAERPEITANGWYDPPPDGVAVLFATEDEPARTQFSSLRPKGLWPGPTELDPRRGILYAYCSPLSFPEALAGDFQVTLYFGGSSRVRDHFRLAIDATYTVITEIELGTRSRPLFDRSEEIFAQLGLRSNVASITDAVPVDLGHSLPTLERPPSAPRVISPEEQDAVRRGRLFISAASDWPLAAAGQVTIEPRLFSIADRRLPQVNVHYVVGIADGKVSLLNECDELHRQFGLMP